MNHEKADRLKLRIVELAGLPDLDYQTRRKGEAKEMGVTVAFLDRMVAAARRDLGLSAPSAMQGGDSNAAPSGRPFAFADPEPWPEPVDGAALLDEIFSVLRRHVFIGENEAAICSVWALHTYLFDAWPVTPYLLVNSPIKGCGKTTLRAVLSKIVRRPLPLEHISPACLFRAVEKFSPTLLLDECDQWLRDSPDLINLLNGGYRYDGQVLRAHPETFEPLRFPTFCPKAIFMIAAKIHGTLEDRAIRVLLHKRTVEYKLERERLFDGKELRMRCVRWANDNRSRAARVEPDIIADLINRPEELWRPLAAIATVCGGMWPQRIRAALEASEGMRQDNDPVLMLLSDLRDALKEAGGRISSKDFLGYLLRRDDRPWAVFSRGEPINERTAASMLARMGIRPKNIRSASNVRRGYELDSAAQAAFACYLDEKPLVSDQGKRIIAAVWDMFKLTEGDPLRLDPRDEMPELGCFLDGRPLVPTHYAIDAFREVGVATRTTTAPDGETLFKITMEAAREAWKRSGAREIYAASS